MNEGSPAGDSTFSPIPMDGRLSERPHLQLVDSDGKGPAFTGGKTLSEPPNEGIGMSAEPSLPRNPARRMNAEAIERHLQRRPARDLLVLAGTLLIAIVSVPIVGFHPGIVALFAGIGVAAILRFLWIERRVAPLVIARRYLLCMTLVGVVGLSASGAEIVVMRPTVTSIAGATLFVGVLFVLAGVYGYRLVPRA